MENDETSNKFEMQRKKFKDQLKGKNELEQALKCLGLKEDVSLEQLDKAYELYKQRLLKSKISNRQLIDRTIKKLKPQYLSVRTDFINTRQEKRQEAEAMGSYLTMEESKKLGKIVREKRKVFKEEEQKLSKLIKDKNKMISLYSQLETDTKKAYDTIKAHLEQLKANKEKGNLDRKTKEEKIEEQLNNASQLTDVSSIRQNEEKIINLQEKREFYFRINSLYHKEKINIGAKADFSPNNIMVKNFPQEVPPLLSITNLKDGSIVELRNKQEISYRAGLQVENPRGMVSKLNIYDMTIRERTGKVRNQYEVKAEPLNIAQISSDENLKQFVLLGLFSEEYSKRLPGRYVGHLSKIKGRIVVTFDEAAIDLSQKIEQEKKKRQEEVR